MIILNVSLHKERTIGYVEGLQPVVTGIKFYEKFLKSTYYLQQIDKINIASVYPSICTDFYVITISLCKNCKTIKFFAEQQMFASMNFDILQRITRDESKFKTFKTLLCKLQCYN